MVPFLVSNQEIHCSTYIASPIEGHNAAEPHQVNEALHPLEDPFFVQIVLKREYRVLEVF